MNRQTLLLALVLPAVAAAQPSQRLEIAADRIAGSRDGGSLVASGNVTAVSHPFRLKTEYCEKTPDGVTRFAAPTEFTTCTNREGCLHWSLSGEAEYVENRHIVGRGLVLRLWEIPVFWLPWCGYPLDGVQGLRVMGGYTGRWGAYVMNRYLYHLAGDAGYGEETWWLRGGTQLDLRYRNGIALGQELDWRLGDFGRGFAKVYYAWDEDYDRYEDQWSDPREWNYRNWGSTVPYGRYGVELGHRWEASERDLVRLKGSVFSDSYFRRCFFRESFFNLRNQYNGYEGNELAWEHAETAWGAGMSVSGPLNRFVSGVSRLPELYFDVVPQSVLGTFVDYDSASRLGYLRRQAAEFGDSSTSPVYRWNPGRWADYGAVRFDTYHRLSAPFRAWDVLSVVPRLAYRGTFWGEGGRSNYTGYGTAGKCGSSLFRSIAEGGVTFAGRGVADFDGGWRHVLEPYLDVLAQEAWFSGLDGGNRPYVFDALDASTDWSDQFAGRSRNLPYSYYGVTPGVRNVLRRTDERGETRTILDFDLYTALQFRRADLAGSGYHRLADPGSPNLGERDLAAVPGVRLRWFPDEDTSLSGRLEYDVDDNCVALAEFGWRQRLARNFSCYASVFQRDYRWWDFSSTPYDASAVNSENFNRARWCFVEAGFEHELCDAVAWSPFLRWDCAEGTVDSVGAWLDLRTDCLGFRFLLEYSGRRERIDGTRVDDDWDVGFFVYLRAFGPDSGSVF